MVRKTEDEEIRQRGIFNEPDIAHKVRFFRLQYKSDPVTVILQLVRT